ncbi:MAG: 23S rRNA pseudouridine(955/2504/2580) synthase RluC [Ectothiorhodospiraceae bacterium]|nr:23S rRNA pseudouridine(955/2504/2580) synthase RluC [Ectothiorhodospiraceae bacterium]
MNETENKSNLPQTLTKARFVEIDEERAGQRIDNFLLASLKGVPKSRVYRILRKGEVRVNKGRIKASYRLKAGDTVRIPPIRLADTEAPVSPGAHVLARINDSIVVEEKGFLVLNKPSGLAVHGGSGLDYGIIEAMRALRPEAPYLELVHRLDRETSGCLLIAKRRSILREMHRLLREKGRESATGKMQATGDGMDKRYLALLMGKWKGDERRIDAPLLKNTLRSGERIVTINPEGKSALTFFRPIARYKEATLVEVRLMTGRTHQIRVHAASMGNPIAGDQKYGDETFNRTMKTRGLNRLFLHAKSLGFSLALEGHDQPYRYEAPLEKALELVLNTLAKLP